MEEKKEVSTELVFILDRSGSMSSLREDTIGGFNSMLGKERDRGGKCLVSTVLFNQRSTVLHDRIPIEKVEPMTPKEYETMGCTALLDAVGSAIHHIGVVQKYAREEDRPGRTLFVITTDGLENSSLRYGYDDVKAMIERQTDRYGWEFIFFGANIDAAKEAGRLGIRRERAVHYHSDEQGTRLNYKAMAQAVECLRTNVDIDASSWRKDVDEDFRKRS